MKKKNNWTIFISLASFVISVLCAAFVILKNLKMGVCIDEGATFIGICTSLISACATFMVGLQIYNHLEFSKVKDKTKELEERISEMTQLKEEITKDKKHLEEVVDIFARGISNTFNHLAKQTMENNPNTSAISDSLFAINAFMYMKDIHSPRVSRVLKRRLEFILELANTFQNDTIDDEKFAHNFKLFKNIVIPNSYEDYFELVQLHSTTVMKLEKIIIEK